MSESDRIGNLSALGRIIRGMIAEDSPTTLLAVCPNSEAVARAALRAAGLYDAPAVFAATLNQVDLDGGYTGWTPAQFISFVERESQQAGLTVPVFVGLDHGGPWTKDIHFLAGLSFDETFDAAKRSVAACLDAGYASLHIDATVDPRLEVEVPLDEVIERTVELMAFSEDRRLQLGRDPVTYEVGTEEVHGGMADMERFEAFVRRLATSLTARGLANAWPAFFVGRVGTDLHTSHFDVDAARSLGAIVRPFGSVIKGHYTDYVDSPSDYPRVRVGGANVGPEFADAEVRALDQLCTIEARRGADSGFRATLRDAVVRSDRWRKWLSPAERGTAFDRLDAERQEWLIRTGSRYVWTAPAVVEARRDLYNNVADSVDADEFVVGEISACIARYIRAFNLVGFAGDVSRWLDDPPAESSTD